MPGRQLAWASVLLLTSGTVASGEPLQPRPGSIVIRQLTEGSSGTPMPCEAIDGRPTAVYVAQDGMGIRITVEVPEPPGPGMGVHVAWALGQKAPSAEHIARASYRPQDLRGPKYATPTWARGKWSSDPGKWRIEMKINPFPPGPMEGRTAHAFRLALAVTGRAPNRVAFSPPATAFSSSETWALVEPLDEGRPPPPPPYEDPDGKPEPGDDDARLRFWRQHLEARAKGGPSETARERLIGPLDKAIAARPDLVMLHVVKGDTLRDLGDLDGAQAAYDQALEVGPHFPEAKWARERLRAMRWLERKPSDPSDYAAAFARIAEGAKDAPPASPAPALAEGLLRYRAGEFDDSIRFLGSFAKTHAFDREIVETARLAERAREAWGPERAYRMADERKGDLPRVRLVTAKGAAVFELFEDQAPNTVANFVWIAKHGFYDGTRFDKARPFAALRGGDPFTREGAAEAGAEVGTGGPGWAIPAEPQPTPEDPSPARRRAFRGTIAMDDDEAGTAGSRFFLVTGTTAYPEGRNTVFGRVVEGQDVVERLVEGDVLEKIEVVRTRDHEYRPRTVAGEPAPEPKAVARR